MANQILEASESFVCEIKGERFMVNAGTTRVASGHALADAYPERFRPVEDGLSFGVEEATNEPGRPRARRTSQTDKEAAASAGGKDEDSGKSGDGSAEQSAEGAEVPAKTGLTTESLRPSSGSKGKGSSSTAKEA